MKLILAVLMCSTLLAGSDEAKIYTYFDNASGQSVVEVNFYTPPRGSIYQIVVKARSARRGSVESSQTLDLTRARFKNYTYTFDFPFDLEDIESVYVMEMRPEIIASSVKKR